VEVDLVEEPVEVDLVEEQPSQTNLQENVAASQTIQYKAVIGKPVKWKKRVILKTPDKNVVVSIHKDADEIVIKDENDQQIVKAKIDGESVVVSDISSSEITGNILADTDLLERVFMVLGNQFSRITAYSIVSADEQDVDIIVEDIVEEVEVEYVTPPPMAEEILTENGKTVIVYSEVEYENVLTYSKIPEVSPGAVRLYWSENSTEPRREVTNDPSVNLQMYDTNENDLVDYLEWNTPHTSNQTFDIEITVLNPYEYLKDGDTWIVRFDTVGTGNLTISTNNSAWEEIGTDLPTVDEMEFLNLECGEVDLSNQLIIVDADDNEYSYSDITAEDSIKPVKFKVVDYSCDDTGYFRNYMNIGGYAVLKLEFANEEMTVVDMAYDPDEIEFCHLAANYTQSEALNDTCQNVYTNGFTWDVQGNNLTVSGNVLVNGTNGMIDAGDSGAMSFGSITISSTGLYNATNGTTTIVTEIGGWAFNNDASGGFNANNGTIVINSPTSTKADFEGDNPWNLIINLSTGGNQYFELFSDPVIDNDFTILNGNLYTQGNDEDFTVVHDFELVNGDYSVAVAPTTQEIGVWSVGSLFIGVGTSFNATNGTMTVTGTDTNYNLVFSGSFGHGNGTTILNNSDGYNYKIAGVMNSENAFYNVIVDSAAVNSYSDIYVDGNLTINSGAELDVAVYGGGDIVNVTGNAVVHGALVTYKDESQTHANSYFGSLTIENGGTYIATNETTIISGDLNNSGTFIDNDGRVEFDSSAIVFGINNTNDFYDLNVSTGTLRVLDGYSLDVENDVVLSGILNASNTQDHSFGSLTINSGGTYNATSGTTEITDNDGTYSVNFVGTGVLIHNNGTFNITTPKSTYLGNQGLESYYNLIMDMGDVAHNIRLGGGNCLVANDFTASSGDMWLESLRDFIVDGDVVIESGSKITGNTYPISFGSLTINDGGIYSATSGTTNVTNGVLDISGSFTHNGGSVYLNGGGVSRTNNIDFDVGDGFYDLYLYGPATSWMKFDGNITVEHDLTGGSTTVFWLIGEGSNLTLGNATYASQVDLSYLYGSGTVNNQYIQGAHPDHPANMDVNIFYFIEMDGPYSSSNSYIKWLNITRDYVTETDADKNLTLLGDCYFQSYTLSGGDTLNVTSGVNVTFSGDLNVNGNLTVDDGVLGLSIINVTENVIVNGLLNASQASAAWFGSLTINSGGTYEATNGTTTITSEYAGKAIKISGAGTFTHNDGIVNVTTDDDTIFDADTTFNNFQIYDNGNNRTYTLEKAFDVDGNLTITSGGFDSSGSNFGITVDGDVILGSGANITGRASTISFGSLTINDGGIYDATSGTTNVTNACILEATGTLTQNGGILSVGANSDFKKAITTDNAGSTIILIGQTQMTELALSLNDILTVTGQRLEFTNVGGTPSISGTLNVNDAMLISPRFNIAGGTINSNVNTIWMETGNGNSALGGEGRSVNGTRFVNTVGTINMITADINENVIIGAGTFQTDTLDYLRTRDVRIVTGAIWQADDSVNTISGDWVSSGGLIGKSAFECSGSTYMTVPDQAALDITTAITIEAWIKTSTSQHNTYLVRKGSGVYQVEIENDVIKFQIYVDGANSPIFSTTTLNDGKWHHITATWDGTTQKIYTDGKLENSTALSGTLGTDSGALGIGAINSGVNAFTGQIAMVRVFDDARNQSEIRADMFNPFADMDDATNLVAMYQFDEGTSTAVDNVEGTEGLDGTMSAASWASAGTFTPGTSTLNFTKSGTVTPDGLTNVSSMSVGGSTVLNVSDALTVTSTLTASGNLDVYGTLDINNGYNHTFNALTIHNGGTCSATSGIMSMSGNLINYGIFTNNSGTVGFAGNATVVGINSTYAFNDLNVSTDVYLKTLGHNTSGIIADGDVDVYGTLDARGGGLDFDGTGDYVNVGDDATLQVSNGTVSMWFNLESFVNSEADHLGLIEKYYNDADRWLIIVDKTTENIKLYTSSGLTLTSDTVVSENNWYYLTLTFDELDGTKMYINGIEEDSSATNYKLSTVTSTSDIHIGRYTYSGAMKVFNGTISDTRIYNRALTATEISAMYNGSYVSDSGLVGWWMLNDVGATAVDSSSSGNDGTLEGDPTWVGNNPDTSFGSLTINTDGTYDATSGTTTVAEKTTVGGIFDAGSGDLSLGSGFTGGHFALQINSAGTFVGGSGNHTMGSFYSNEGTATFTSGVTTIDAVQTSLTVAFALHDGTWDDGNGTITFTYAGDQFLYDEDNTARTFYNIILNKASGIVQYFNGQGFALTVDNDLTITSGEYDTADSGGISRDLTVTGDVDVTGTLTGNAGTHSFGSLTINTDGTYDATSGLTTVLGNLINYGAFTNNSGTVNMTGANNSLLVGINSTYPFNDFVVDTSTNVTTRQYRGDIVADGDVTVDGILDSRGAGLDFDGTGDYVNVSDVDNLIGLNYTYSFWLKPSTLSGFYGIIDKIVDESGFQGILITQYDDLIQVYTDAGSTTCSVSFFVEDTWVYATVVVGDDSCLVYKNGDIVLTDNTAHTVTANDENFYIGQQDSSSRFFNGEISDTRIYNRSLTATEVSDLYNNNYDNTTGLVGHWKLDDASGSSAADSSGEGNTGTLEGDPTWISPDTSFGSLTVNTNGVYSATSGMTTVSGLTDVYGTFDAGSGDLSLASGSTAATSALTINTGGTFTGGSGAHTMGSITDGVGTGTTTLSSGVTTFDGQAALDFAMSLSAVGNFDDGDGTIVFTYAGDQVIHSQASNARTFYNVIVNKTSGEVRQGHPGQSFNMTIDNDLTIISGEYDTADSGGTSRDLTVTGDVDVTGTLIGNAGTHSFGSLTINNGGTYDATSGTTTLTGVTGNNKLIDENGGTFTHNNGTVEFTSGTSYQIDGFDYYDLVIPSSYSAQSNMLYLWSAAGSFNDVNIAFGKTFNLYLGPEDLNITGDVIVNGTLQAAALFDGKNFSMGSLTINDGGEYEATSGTTTIAGNLSRIGTFTNNSGVVELSGANAYVTNDTDFNNVTVSGNVTFQNETNYTMINVTSTGNLTYETSTTQTDSGVYYYKAPSGFVTLSSGNLTSVSSYLNDSSLSSNTEGTDNWLDVIVSGIWTVSGWNTDPELSSVELYPASPQVNQDLTITVNCYDVDGDTLTAYWDLYKDGVNQTALSGSGSATNATDTSLTVLTSGNTSTGDVWIAETWCGDGTANTSKTNSTSRTIVAVPVQDGSPSSPGGGIATPKKGQFTISPKEIIAPLPRKGFKAYEFVINSPTGDDFDLEIDTSESNDHVDVTQKKFTVYGARENVVKVTILAGTQLGTSTGKLIFKSDIRTVEIPIVVEVESERVIFDSKIDVLPNFKLVDAGDTLKTHITLLPVGPKERTVDAIVTYTIKDLKNNILYTESETFAVHEQMGYDKEIVVPDGLEEGSYVVNIDVLYENAFATSSSLFEVRGEELEEIEEYGNILLILMLILIPMAIYLIFEILKHLKDR
jgi:hypothetical protein